jgi:nucleotide-binding universal stress UspA family protein
VLPFKRIVSPSDFSDPSYEAVKAANELAVHFSAELILIHVISPVPTIPSPEAATGFDVLSYQQQMEVYAKRSLDQVVKERISDQVKVRTMVKLGSAAEQIANMAVAEKSDLIVIATHGLMGWRRFVFGSVTEKVVRLAQCPVLTIHQPQEPEANP